MQHYLPCIKVRESQFYSITNVFKLLTARYVRNTIAFFDNISEIEEGVFCISPNHKLEFDTLSV